LDKPLSSVQRLIQYWTSLGYVVKTGASEQSLRAFEARYHVLLPPDIRTYFIIGDYLINSHFYAVQLTQDPFGSNAVVEGSL